MAAKKAPIWKGPTAKAETPDGFDYERSANGEKLVRVFEGKFETLLAAMPKNGDIDADYPKAVVDVAKLTRLRGGKGRLVVTLTNTGSIETDSNVPFQPIFEVEWTQLERPLESLKRYNLLVPGGGTKGLTDDDKDKLHGWEQAPSAAKRAELFATLSDNAKEVARKKSLGITTGLLFAPVARITSQCFRMPKTNRCGLRYGTTVPGFGDDLPAGYIWLKTADRATRTGRNGKWQRVEEWTGAEWWDTEIYEAAT